MHSTQTECGKIRLYQSRFIVPIHKMLNQCKSNSACLYTAAADKLCNDSICKDETVSSLMLGGFLFKHLDISVNTGSVFQFEHCRYKQTNKAATKNVPQCLRQHHK